MAFNHKKFCVLAYADRCTMWKYTTSDPGAEVMAPGYFDEAANMFGDVDWIVCATDIGSPAAQAGFLMVNLSEDGRSVTVANIGEIK